VCIGVQAETMKKTTLKILTFNILHGATTEGTFDLDRIAQVIIDADPDLVALQEVDFKTRRARGYDLATELGLRTKMASIFAKAMDHDGGEYGEAILSRGSFETMRRIPLPFTGDSEPRAAIEVTLSLPGGQTIAFVGTHLDHASTSDREAQAQALNAACANKAIPTLLAGDFNATPESKTIAILKEHWTVAGGDSPPPTFPSDDPKIKIDYVMYAPASRWTVVETRVIQDAVASDHCAYLVTLVLSGE
jgi:endonuclease/exonuclease/phosphatase family metal-dependent hydrolase